MDCVLSCSITLVQAWVLKVLKSLVSRLRGNDVTRLSLWEENSSQLPCGSQSPILNGLDHVVFQQAIQGEQGRREVMASFHPFEPVNCPRESPVH